MSNMKIIVRYVSDFLGNRDFFNLFLSTKSIKRTLLTDSSLTIDYDENNIVELQNTPFKDKLLFRLYQIWSRIGDYKLSLFLIKHIEQICILSANPKNEEEYEESINKIYLRMKLIKILSFCNKKKSEEYREEDEYGTYIHYDYYRGCLSDGDIFGAKYLVESRLITSTMFRDGINLEYLRNKEIEDYIVNVIKKLKE